MAKNTRILTDIAFKKLANASITNPGSSEFQEPIGTNIQLGLGTIFGETPPPTPPTTLFETSSGAVVQYVEFDLVAIAEGNYDASTYSGDSSNYDDIDGNPGIEDHAFAVVLSGSYETDGADNPKSGTGLFTNGAYLSGSDGTLQLVPPSYGVAYQAVVVDENGDDLNIAVDSQDFYIDYYAGVVFRQDGDSSPYPTKLKAYLYTGDYADTTIRSGSFSGSFEGDGTNLDLSSNPTVPGGYGDSDVTDHINSLGVISGSEQVNADNITNFDTNVVDALPTGTVSGSSQVNADSITNFDTNVVDALPAGTISGSSQVNADSITNFDTNVVDALPAGTISGSSQVNADSILNFDTNVVAGLPTGTISGSAEGTSQGQIQLNGVDVNIKDLGTDDSPTFTNLTLSGNLTVQGTTTTVDSTTVNISSSIIRVNYGGAVAEGGMEVTDATGGSTITGSLLWDGTNDYWKGGPKGSEVKFLRETGDGIFSGSAQVNADSITNFDSNVLTYVNTLGVFSGSAQVNADTITNFDTNVVDALPAGTISSSVQVNADSITNFDSNVLSYINTLEVVSGSITHYTDADTLNYINSLGVFSGSSQVNADSILNFDTNVVDALPAGTISGSSQVNADSITNFDANVLTYVNTLGVFSGSAQVSLSGFNTGDLSEGTNKYYTDERVKTKLNTEGVISGSSQVNADNVTNFDSNVLTYINSLEVVSGSITHYTDADTLSYINGLGVVSGSSQINADNVTNFDSNVLTYINSLGVFSGSAQVSLAGFDTGDLTEGSNLYYTDERVKTKLNTEGVISSSAQLSDTFLSKTGDNVVSGSAQIKSLLNSDLGGAITIGDANDGVIIPGDLTVSGTTTTVNSTIVNIDDNIIVLNYGGSETDGGIHVTDGPNTGSLLWDGTNDYWKAGPLGSEKRVVTFNAGNPTNDSFIHLNGSDEVVAIASGSTVGAFLQKTANGFEVSAVIDGGTY